MSTTDDWNVYITDTLIDIKDQIDILFLFISSIIVILMQVGLLLLEVSACRKFSTISIVLKTLLIFSLCSVIWCVWGNGIVTGEDAGGILGVSEFFFESVDTPAGASSFFYQITFACTSALIGSQGLAERARIQTNTLSAIIICAIQYPLIAHWIWHPEGWLYKWGFEDFGGACVVHMTGGIAAMVCSWIVGPRISGIDHETGILKNIPGTSLTIKILGFWLIWIGSYGFNVGSLFSMFVHDEEAVIHVAIITFIVPAFAMGMSMIYIFAQSGKIHIDECIDAALFALFATAANAKDIPLGASFFVGAFAPVFSNIFIKLIPNRLHIDDPINSITLHFFGGFWGLFTLGLFHADKGFFMTGNPIFLLKEITGGIVCSLFAAAMQYSIINLFQKKIFKDSLRVEEHIEVAGCDSQFGSSFKEAKDEAALAFTVKDLFEVPELHIAFEKFLRSIHCEENLLFYESLTSIEKTHAEDNNKATLNDDRYYLILESVVKLWKQFLSPDAPQQVNLPSYLINHLEKSMQPLLDFLATNALAHTPMAWYIMKAEKEAAERKKKKKREERQKRREERRRIRHMQQAQNEHGIYLGGGSNNNKNTNNDPKKTPQAKNYDEIKENDGMMILGPGEEKNSQPQDSMMILGPGQELPPIKKSQPNDGMMILGPGQELPPIKKSQPKRNHDPTVLDFGEGNNNNNQPKRNHDPTVLDFGEGNNNNHNNQSKRNHDPTVLDFGEGNNNNNNQSKRNHDPTVLDFGEGNNNNNNNQQKVNQNINASPTHPHHMSPHMQNHMPPHMQNHMPPHMQNHMPPSINTKVNSIPTQNGYNSGNGMNKDYFSEDSYLSESTYEEKEENKRPIINLAMFTEAKREIIRLIETNMLSHFQESEIFAEYFEKLVSKNKKSYPLDFLLEYSWNTPTPIRPSVIKKLPFNEERRSRLKKIYNESKNSKRKGLAAKVAFKTGAEHQVAPEIAAEFR